MILDLSQCLFSGGWLCCINRLVACVEPRGVSAFIAGPELNLADRLDEAEYQDDLKQIDEAIPNSAARCTFIPTMRPPAESACKDSTGHESALIHA